MFTTRVIATNAFASYFFARYFQREILQLFSYKITINIIIIIIVYSHKNNEVTFGTERLPVKQHKPTRCFYSFHCSAFIVSRTRLALLKLRNRKVPGPFWERS